MDVSGLFFVACVTFIVYKFGGRLYKFWVFYQRLNKLPGPKYAIPFLGLPWELMKIEKKDRMDWHEKRAFEYDGIFHSWMGPVAVVELETPEYVEVILHSNTEITKSMIYDFFLPWLGQGLITSTGPQWFHSRKMLTPAFHFRVLEDFAEVMIEKANIFNKCIEKEIKIHGDKPFDIFEPTVRCTLDIICETAMGVDIKAQEDIDNPYSKAIYTISSVAMSRFFHPWLIPDWIFYRTPSGKAFSAAVETAHSGCTDVIEKKQRERKLQCAKKDEVSLDETSETRKKKAFLDLLLEANEMETNPLTIEEIRDQANTFMFAGHDTTGALVGWTLFTLGNHLDIQKKLHEELDEVLGDADNQATLKLLPNLKYLERVMKEVLRLYPSAATVSRQLVEDMKFDDYIVPKGANVSIEIYLLHRNPKVWPDPLRFDPDRFLPENIKGRHPYAYIPFSAGPRNCIGQKFALLEAKVILAQVLRTFSIRSIEDEKTIEKIHDVILRPAKGIYVNMTKRERGQ